MGERTRTYNTRKAQELGLWAMDSGRGDPFHQAAFRAYFVHGRNLAKRYDKLSQKLFNTLHAPFLRASFVKQKKWIC